MTSQALYRILRRYARFIFAAGMPLVFAPLPVLVPNSLGYTAYVLMLLAIYWMTLVIPLGITGLLPIFLFPLFGIQTTNHVVSFYASNLAYLVVGALFVAIAMEHHNLHTRIALRLILLIGLQPRRLLLGIMVSTYFLSMWMSNIAVITIMIPIVEAILDQMKPIDKDIEKTVHHELKENREKMNGRETLVKMTRNTSQTEFTASIELDELATAEVNGVAVITSDVEGEIQDGGSWDTEAFVNFSKGAMMCIPWAANLGGSAVFTGSAINPFFLAFLEGMFGPVGITFANWSFFSLPLTAVILILMWAWLQWKHVGGLTCRRGKGGGKGRFDATALIKHVVGEYQKLGSIRYAEYVVIGHLVTLVLLWIFRAPGFMPGWGDILFPDGSVLDSVPSIIIAVSLFIFPSELPTWSEPSSEGRNDTPDIEEKPVLPILTWPVVKQKMYWELIFVIGGIMSLSEAMQTSGLGAWMASGFTWLTALHPALVVVLIAVFISFTTEVVANATTMAIFVPLVSQIAVQQHVNPLYYAMTVGYAAMFSFMLPAASFPNFLAYSTGKFAIKDMMKTGIGCNVIGICVLVLAINTLGRWVYNMDEYPDWADNFELKTDNVTAMMTTTMIP